MATVITTRDHDQKSARLREFYESEEEDIARKLLEIISTETEFPVPSFLNLVINNSNASAGKSFSDAWIYLQVCHEIQEIVHKKYGRYPKVGLVYLKDLLDLSVFEDFRTYGVHALMSYPEGCWHAFLTLLEFLHEKEKHEEALEKVIAEAKLLPSGVRDQHILAGFAHHLFSQLVPNNMYEVDEHEKSFPVECVCGCKAKICRGNTSVGSERTWHGRVDTMVNDMIAVTVGKTPVDGSKEDDDEDEKDEPQRKQRKTESDWDSDTEVNYNKRHKCVLLEPKFLEKILAKSITNGFAQVNRDKNNLSGFFIPTFGVTSDHVSICLYDPESDCLLHIREEYGLWFPGSRKKLNELTIIAIWIFLNFTVLTRRRVAAVFEDIDKSGLHAALKGYLTHYREAKLKENFDIQPTVESPWKYVHAHPIKS